MEKRISVTQFRSIKRIAQAVNPLIIKKNKLQAQLNALKEEIEDYKEQIKGMDAGCIAMTGLQSEDLFTKVVEPTGKFDKDGKALKETKYVPTSLIRRDEATGEYVITLPGSENEGIEAPAKEEAPVNLEEPKTAEPKTKADDFQSNGPDLTQDDSIEVF